MRQKVLSICDYSNGFILVTGDITVTSDNNADIVLTNCASFSPHAWQKLMCLLMKQTIFTFQGLCTI